jgi:putative phosphoesterase
MATRIGILSDTHMPAELRVLYEEVRIAFEGVDLILHAGDINNLVVLDQLEEWAPVLAVRGNHDRGLVDRRLDDHQRLDIEGYRLVMVHDMEPEDDPIDDLCRRYLRGKRPDIMVTGHTHFERLDYREGVLQVNSGSPVQPHLRSTRMGTVAVLDIEPGQVRARIVRIGETPDKPNPGVEQFFDGATVHIL